MAESLCCSSETVTTSLIGCITQSLSCFWLFATPWTAAHRPPCPSPPPRVCPSSCSLHQGCCPAVSSSSPSALDLSQHQWLFQWVVCSYQVTKILELQLQLQHQSFQGTFRVDIPQDWLVWSPCYPRDLQESSILWHFAFFTVQFSQPHLTIGRTIALYTDLCQQSNISAFQYTV